MYLTGLLRKAGFKEQVIVYCLAHIMYETADLTSDLAQNFNNLSGITFVNQKAASGSHNGFAIYKTAQDWANDYYRVLGLSPGHPRDATSDQQFFDGLRANHYFTDSDKTYAAGLTAKIKKINKTLADAIALGKKYASGEMDTYTTGGDGSLKPGDVQKRNVQMKVAEKTNVAGKWIQDHKLLAGVGAAIAGLIIIRSLTD
jgi:hypothetical protein